MKIKLIIAIVFLFGILIQTEAQVRKSDKRNAKTKVEGKIENENNLKTSKTTYDTPRPRLQKQVSGSVQDNTNLSPDVKKQVRFENGYFSTNEIYFVKRSDRIQSSSYEILDHLAKYIIGTPDHWHLTIIAHTAGEENSKANEELSKARANSIKIYFNTKYGLNKNQISVVGKDYKGIKTNSQSDADEIAISHLEFKFDKEVPKTSNGVKSDFKKESL